QRSPLFSGLPCLWISRPQVTDVFHFGSNIPFTPISLLSGEPEFQSFDSSLLFFDIPGDRFLRTTDHPFWIRLPAHTFDRAAALSLAGAGATVDRPSSFLPVGQLPW